MTVNQPCFLETPEYDAAFFLQSPVDDVLEEMNTSFAKYEPKIKWLNSLVSLL